MPHSRMLNFLDEVERAGSIRRASLQLNVAASSINRQIIAFEKKIGVQIFERSNKRLKLTESGALVIAHVRQTLKHQERLFARIEDMKRKRQFEVTVATASGLALELLPGVVANFHARNVAAKINVQTLSIGQIVTSLASGETDLGVGVGFPDEADVEVFAAWSTKPGLVMAPEHELASHASVTLQQLARHRLVLAARGMPVRHLLDEAAAEANVRLESILESNSMKLLKGAARLGLGVTVVFFAEVEDDVRRGDLVFVPLDHPSAAAEAVKIVYRQGSVLDGPYHEFAECLQSAMRVGQSSLDIFSRHHWPPADHASSEPGLASNS